MPDRKTPRPLEALDPPPMLELTISAKFARLDLNPTVPVLAMLLPMMVRLVPLAFKPLTAA